MVYERKAEQDHRFADTLTSRRRRAEVRAKVQAEDLDVAPAEVTRLVRMRLLAALGGQARARILKPARRREIARKAAAARWSK
jgi:hypothetical protein